jgi:hypothetical protein
MHPQPRKLRHADKQAATRQSLAFSLSAHFEITSWGKKGAHLSIYQFTKAHELELQPLLLRGTFYLAKISLFLCKCRLI